MTYHDNITGMTWGQLEENLEDKADPLGLTILGHLLDDVAEETGSWPDWSDPVPSATSSSKAGRSGIYMVELSAWLK